jgi:hypothetical protein
MSRRCTLSLEPRTLSHYSLSPSSGARLALQEITTDTHPFIGSVERIYVVVMQIVAVIVIGTVIGQMQQVRDAIQTFMEFINIS